MKRDIIISKAQGAYEKAKSLFGNTTSVSEFYERQPADVGIGACDGYNEEGVIDFVLDDCTLTITYKDGKADISTQVEVYGIPNDCSVWVVNLDKGESVRYDTIGVTRV